MDEQRDQSLIVPNAALPDTRSEREKAKQFTDEEVAGAPAVEPFKHSKITKLAATIFDQWYTSSCVPHGFLTTLEYEGFITAATIKSQLRLYRKRINYSGAGSIAYDIWNKIRAGLSPNAEAPVKPAESEATANAMPYVEGTKDIPAFNDFEITDYTRIAGYVAAGKAIPVFIYATEDEWSAENVDIKTPGLTMAEAYVSHCVCLVPEGDFTDEHGVQRFAVHDSAAFGGLHLRYASLDFILKRAFYAGRIEKAATPPAPAPVDSTPDVACKLGDRGDAVLALQRFLVGQGKLASEYITGYYGALTARAVLWYQLSKWEQFTSTIPELLDLRGESWGPQSIGTLG